MRALLYALSLPLPWAIRRRVLAWCLGYRLHPKSRIGLAWVLPDELVMEEGSRIDTLTVCKGVHLLHLKRNAYIGKGNWITGFPLGPSKHFAHQPDRRPELIVGDHSAITHRHLIDCTNQVTIGTFSTFAGFRSQILTHSIDLENNRQSSSPITIGDYAFVGTDSVLLGGSALPSYSVLGAKALLNKKYTETYWLYGGNPAKPICQLSPETKYFHRQIGTVD